MKKSVLLIVLMASFTATAQTVDFSFQSVSGTWCIPVQVEFTPQVTGEAINYTWDFGDGQRSNAQAPVYTFTSAGTYSVELTVYFEKTTLSQTKTVEIHVPNSVNLSVDRDFICQPGDIHFTASGVGTQNYEFDFGDGSTATLGSGTVAHSYSSFSEYDVFVTATNSYGCIAKDSVKVTLKPVELTATHLAVTYCVGVPVNFDAVASIPDNSSVSSYTWDFGDGNSVTSGAANVVHTYGSKNVFTSKVSLVTTEGCTAEFTLDPAYVGIQTSITSAYPLVNQVCASDTAVFEVVSPDADFFIWIFGDGNSDQSSSNQIEHKYDQLGIKYLTVIPFDSYGCPGIAEGLQVETIGVISDFSFQMDCDDDNKFDFINNSAGNVTSFLWDFDDGNQNTVDYNASHVFAPEDSFNVNLYVEDAVTGCSYNSEQLIYTTTNIFSAAASKLCKNDEVVFTVKNDRRNPATRYTYHIGSDITGPVEEGTLQWSSTLIGNFQGFVVSDNGPGFCPDTAYLQADILVAGPHPDFNATAAICDYDSIYITNNSYPFVMADSILYVWEVDGNKYSEDEHPDGFMFSDPGIHEVTLLASDLNGCKDTLTVPVTVNASPIVRIVADDEEICAGSQTTLTVLHIDPVTWSSDQALSCISCDQQIINPPIDAFYAVEAITPAGCVAHDTIYIKVQQKFTAAAVNPVSDICPGESLSFHLTADADVDITWVAPQGEAVPTGFDPVVIPIQSGTYTATLSDKAGCFTEDLNFDVNLYDPAFVDAGPDITVSFNDFFRLEPDYSNNIVKYEWLPAGDLDCVFCPEPTGTATKPATYTVQVTTNDGCEAKDSVHVYIECSDDDLQMPNSFSPNYDNLNDIFYPITRSGTAIKKFTVFNRNGQIVFNKENFLSNDPKSGWDGRVGTAPAPASVYVYIIEAICSSGETIYRKGTITLIR